MKFLLYLAAFLSFVGPLLFWAYMVALACAYGSNGRPCKVSPSDFWSIEFVWVAAGPWALCALLVVCAYRLSGHAAH